MAGLFLLYLAASGDMLRNPSPFNLDGQFVGSAQHLAETSTPEGWVLRMFHLGRITLGQDNGIKDVPDLPR